MEEPNAERGHKGGGGERLRREGAGAFKSRGRGWGGGSLGKERSCYYAGSRSSLGARSRSARIGGAGPPSAVSPPPTPRRAGRAEEGSGQGNRMGRGKEGKAETPTGGLGRLPVQEGVSKPLCAWHARL